MTKGHLCICLGTIVCDDDFTDYHGYNCIDYINYDWCTSDGDYGSNFGSNWGTFADHADNRTGLTALSCSVCGCGTQGMIVILRIHMLIILVKILDESLSLLFF